MKTQRTGLLKLQNFIDISYGDILLRFVSNFQRFVKFCDGLLLSAGFPLDCQACQVFKRSLALGTNRTGTKMAMNRIGRTAVLSFMQIAVLNSATTELEAAREKISQTAPCPIY
jgi:hypothetical protein